MKLSPIVREFFQKYLSGIRGTSLNTIKALKYLLVALILTWKSLILYDAELMSQQALGGRSTLIKKDFFSI